MQRSIYTRNLAALVLVTSLLIPTWACAEQTLEDIGADQTTSIIHGTVNSLPDDRVGTIIVDDSLVNLSPVVIFNGSHWSRERVLKQLEPGTPIKFELENYKPGPSQTPTITVLDILE